MRGPRKNNQELGWTDSQMFLNIGKEKVYTLFTLYLYVTDPKIINGGSARNCAPLPSEYCPLHTLYLLDGIFLVNLVNCVREGSICGASNGHY